LLCTGTVAHITMLTALTRVAGSAMELPIRTS
jgi:hypothetical protein